MLYADFEDGTVSRINSREARTKWRDLLDTIYRGSPGIVIERYGKPVAALVSYEAFEKLQQMDELVNQLAEPKPALSAVEVDVYTTTAPIDNPMNEPLNELLQTLSADAQELVTAFARLLQQQGEKTAVSTPTVTLPAVSLNNLSQLLLAGYEGDALSDSESLYDDF